MENSAEQQNTEVQPEPKRGVIREIFGQFTTAAFWKDLIRVIVQEAMSAFLMALGGSILWYAKKKNNPEIANVVGAAGNPQGTSSVVARAFGGGFSPTPAYQPSSSYPVPSTPVGDQRFPGFGR